MSFNPDRKQLAIAQIDQESPTICRASDKTRHIEQLLLHNIEVYDTVVFVGMCGALNGFDLWSIPVPAKTTITIPFYEINQIVPNGMELHGCPDNEASVNCQVIGYES